LAAWGFVLLAGQNANFHSKEPAKALQMFVFSLLDPGIWCDHPLQLLQTGGVRNTTVLVDQLTRSIAQLRQGCYNQHPHSPDTAKQRSSWVTEMAGAGLVVQHLKMANDALLAFGSNNHLSTSYVLAFLLVGATGIQCPSI